MAGLHPEIPRGQRSRLWSLLGKEAEQIEGILELIPGIAMQTRGELAENRVGCVGLGGGTFRVVPYMPGAGSPRRSMAYAVGTGLDPQECVLHSLRQCPFPCAVPFAFPCGLLSSAWCGRVADQRGGPFHSRAGFTLMAWKGRWTDLFFLPPQEFYSPDTRNNGGDFTRRL